MQGKILIWNAMTQKSFTDLHPKSLATCSHTNLDLLRGTQEENRVRLVCEALGIIRVEDRISGLLRSFFALINLCFLVSN